MEAKYITKISNEKLTFRNNFLLFEILLVINL